MYICTYVYPYRVYMLLLYICVFLNWFLYMCVCVCLSVCLSLYISYVCIRECVFANNALCSLCIATLGSFQAVSHYIIPMLPYLS